MIGMQAYRLLVFSLHDRHAGPWFAGVIVHDRHDRYAAV